MPGAGMGSWRVLPAWFLPGLLLVLCGPPSHPFEVTLEGTPAEVGYGGSVLLNCSSSCPDPGNSGGLETPLRKDLVVRGPGWVSVTFQNISQPLSQGFCYFSCHGTRKAVPFQVLAYDLPQPQVTITATPRAVAIECWAGPSRPPGRRLRLRGGRRPPQAWVEGPLVRLELLPGEEPDGTEFTCDVQLQLDNQTLRNSSATATLRVTSPTPNLLVPVLVGVLVGVALLSVLGVGYGIYHWKTKIQEYRLRQRRTETRLPCSGHGDPPQVMGGLPRRPPGSCDPPPDMELLEQGRVGNGE